MKRFWKKLGKGGLVIADWIRKHPEAFAAVPFGGAIVAGASTVDKIADSVKEKKEQNADRTCP
jgi:hypothetical protein